MKSNHAFYLKAKYPHVILDTSVQSSIPSTKLPVNENSGVFRILHHRPYEPCVLEKHHDALVRITLLDTPGPFWRQNASLLPAPFFAII